MGRAVLHIHSTNSDGRSTVAEALDRLQQIGGIDVVAFTDHDEVAAWEAAQRWRDIHLSASFSILWGCEITVRGFKHLLCYFFHPPYPRIRFPTLRPLAETLQRISDAGGVVVAAHPDQWIVGVGLPTLEGLLPHPGIVGIETHSPYVRDPSRLTAFARHHDLATIGGSDAHFPQHLTKWFTDFPGSSLSDLEQALRNRQTVPIAGPPAETVPLSELALQQVQSLIVHPSHKIVRRLSREGG